ncbi:MAG: DNA methyltransferase [Patescibacteria group bacterium]
MLVDIKKIKLNPNNPRSITNDKFKSLVKSLRDFPEMLEKRPIVVDENMMILGGNMRLKACLEAGITKVPISIAKDWSEKKKKEFIIKDNLAYGEWDWDILANEWEQEELEDWEMDLPTDWKTDEIEEDDAPEVSDEPAISKLGEIYKLGRHRLMCGDATKIEDVNLLMGGGKADMAFTDPPYNMDYKGAGGQKREGILNDKMTSDSFYQFLKDFLIAIKSKVFGGVYVCMGAKEIGTLKLAMEETGVHWQDIIVWVKNKFVLGGTDYQRQTEYIILGNNGEEFLDNTEEAELIGYGWTKHNWYGGRKNANVWRFDRELKNDLHPTMKPVKLCGTAIVNSSTRGGVCLRCFWR